MKKKLRLAVIVIGVLITIIGFGYSTKMLVWFKIPSLSNYPVVKPGERFLASNLIKPKRFSLICYRTLDYEGKEITALHRLVGLPGDILEIKNSFLYINGKLADDKLNLAKYYKVPVKDEYSITSLADLPEGSVYRNSSDTLLINLTDLEISKNNWRYPIYINAEKNIQIQERYGHKWTTDNFGPYKVPDDCYFVLGDNRQNSYDSRFSGPVEIYNWVCTAIFLK